MNGSVLPTTLAFILSDVVFYGMIAVFVVGPWIAKTIKKISQPQTPPPSRSPGNRTFTDSTPNKPNANELAAMRREKLQELARKRRSTIANRSTTPSQTEPTNLTMAQRVERARAKAQYQKRAQALQQQQQRQTLQQQQSSTPTTARQRAQQKKLARKQALAQQRAQGLQQQQHAAAQQQRSAARVQPAAPRPAKPKPRLTPLQAQHDQGIVHRHVPNAPAPEQKKATNHLKRFGASSLRQAVVLKEILDRPIALRDSAAGI
jgi:hypothetical protein